MSMTESEKVKKWFDSELSMRPEESLDSVECEEVKEICLNAIEEREQYEAIGTVKVFETVIKSQMEYCNRMREYEKIGTVAEFREAMFFKKYFMELYGEGLEVANWHKNGDLEPLDNFIDEAVECGKQEECGENDG